MAHSDLKSAIGAVTTTLGASELSDIASAVWANTIGEARVDSRVLLTQSLASDAHSAAAQATSRALVLQSRRSDFDSRLVSDISDVRSQLLVVQSMALDAHSAAAQGNSRALVLQSRLSDLDSRLVSDLSDVRSALSDAHSDLAAKIGAVTASVGASDISDIASAVWANTIGGRVDSRVLRLIPELGNWLVIWVLVATAINWRRFSRDIVPKFIAGIRSLWNGHGKPRGS